MFTPFKLLKSCHSTSRLPIQSYRRYVHTSPITPEVPGTSSLPKPPALSLLNTPAENTAASEWVKKFSEARGAISKDLVELTFARSSGPGGQNVNKVNTKATVRCPLNQAWIPKWAIQDLAKDTHYVESTHSILVTSTVHRSQSQNVNECFGKLHAIILAAASKPIQHEASAEQKKKVDNLIKADKERRKADKMHRSSVKQARSGKGPFDF